MSEILFADTDLVATTTYIVVYITYYYIVCMSSVYLGMYLQSLCKLSSFIPNLNFSIKVSQVVSVSTSGRVTLYKPQFIMVFKLAVY